MTQRTSPRGLELIKNEEKLGPKYNWTKQTGQIVAYLCPQGVPTIGFGHTRGVLRTDVGIRGASMEQALAWLDDDVRANENTVNRLNAPLNQVQFDALVSLAHNVGSFGETLTRQLKAGDFKRAAVTMKRYIHGSGKGSVPCKGACGVKSCKLRMFPGLVTRRAIEAEMLLEVD